MNIEMRQLLRNAVFGHAGERDLLALGLFQKHALVYSLTKPVFQSYL